MTDEQCLDKLHDQLQAVRELLLTIYEPSIQRDVELQRTHRLEKEVGKYIATRNNY